MQQTAPRAPSNKSHTLHVHSCRTIRRIRANVRVSSSSTPGTSRTDRAQLLDLTQWALSQGIKYAKVRPEQLSGGRGMVATFPIAAGEALVSVPQQAALRVFPGDSPPAPLAAAVASQWPTLPWYLKLACKLACEAQQGSRSSLAAPVAALPRSVDLPATWPAEDLQQLQCQHMIDLVTQQQQDWEAGYHQLAPALTAAGISRQDFTWALAITRSRTFAAPHPPASLSALLPAAAALQAAVVAAGVTLGTTAAAGVEVVGLGALAGGAAWVVQQAQATEQHVLAPLLDMFNHSVDEKSCCELDVISGCFKVSASRPWSAGQQVVISYGPSSNDVLLLLYGFVADSNPQDRYVITDIANKLQQLQAPPSSGGSPQEVTLQAQGLAAEDAAALHQLLKVPAPGSSSGAGVVPYSSCHPDVQALLAGLLQHEQQGLGTSLEEDEQLLEGFKRLPTAQQQLQQLAEQYDAMQRDLEAISQQLAAHAAAEATAVPADSEASAGTSQQQGGTAVAVAATAAAGALPPEAVYAMTAEERRLQQRAREALQQQGQLEEEVAALTRRVTGVRRVAVEYRVQKKRLLAAVRQKLA